MLSLFKKNHGLVKNTAFMLSAEAVSRISRLLTIVVLGFYLDLIQYGTVMLAIVCHDLIRVFTRIGTGAQIIRCSQEELVGFTRSAISLQWILCLVVTLAQISAADYIAAYYNNDKLAGLLKLMALTNLIYPFVASRVFLLQRQNQLAYFSLASAVSISAENLSTALFVFLGFAELSIVYAKFISAICWLIIFSQAPVKHYTPAFNLFYIKRLLNFGGKVLGSELLKFSRFQIDTFFAARLLGPELFGLYSFAKSAGVGLAQSLSAAYLNSLYPSLCQAHRTGRLQSTLKKTYLLSTAIAAIFLVQAMLAPFYIDLFFNAKWQSAALLVSILCLSAIPGLFMDTASTLFRAQNLVNQEVMLSSFGVCSLVIAFVVVMPSSAIDCALLVAFTSLSWIVITLATNSLVRISQRTR